MNIYPNSNSIQKNINFLDYRVFTDSADKNEYWNWILYRSKKKKNFRKIPAVPKIHGRYSEWHEITVSKKMLKTSKMIFFIPIGVFWSEKYKSDVYICRPGAETIDNPKKKIRIIEVFSIKL